MDNDDEDADVDVTGDVDVGDDGVASATEDRAAASAASPNDANELAAGDGDNSTKLVQTRTMRVVVLAHMSSLLTSTIMVVMLHKLGKSRSKS